MADLEAPRHGDRYVEAFEFACEVHRLQARKGGDDVPYVAHLLAVSSLVWEGGGDENQAIAALLHDTVEDHPGVVSLAAIEQRFGPEVKSIVDWATDTDVFPKPPWRARKEAYIKRLKKVDREAVLVIAADKLHNVRSTVDDLRHEGLKALDRFSTNDPTDLLWYYESVSDILSDKARTNVVVRRLRREVRQLAKLLGKLAPALAEPKVKAKSKGKGKSKPKDAKAKRAMVPSPEVPAATKPVPAAEVPQSPLPPRTRSLLRRRRRT